MVQLKMEGRRIIAFFVVVAGAYLARAAEPEDPDQLACRKMAIQYFKNVPKIYKDCHADVKANSSSLEETFEKFGCTVKCILKEDKMLDEHDMVTDDVIKATYKNRVTPKYEDKLMKKFMECKTKFAGTLDKKDEKCVSYKNYGLCMQESLSHVCYE